MNDFSASWLALREPADLAARDLGLLKQLERTFSGFATCRVCDLGAGTGASVRALTKHLPARQHWTLIDHDAALLRTGRQRLGKWEGADNDATSASLDVLDVLRDNQHLTIDFFAADLKLADQQLPRSVNLITASALLDLTSEAWISAFAKAAAGRRAGILATLNFNGEILFSPGHPADSEMQNAFNSHQRRDKGFGPAAGADAAARLVEKLQKLGYSVVTAASPWRLGVDDRDLIRSFVDGMASAITELGSVPASQIDAWHQHHAESIKKLEVGHVDVFAMPPG